MKTISSKLIRVCCAAALAGTTVLAQEALSRADKEFFKEASEMGAAEVQLGKLGAEKGTSNDVKELGKKLVDDHTKSNAELAELARNKKVELKAEPSSAQKSKLASFEKKSGAEFDKEYRDHVAKEHVKAIKLFESTAKETKDPDVKAFAEKNLPALKEHHHAAEKAEKK